MFKVSRSSFPHLQKFNNHKDYWIKVNDTFNDIGKNLPVVINFHRTYDENEVNVHTKKIVQELKKEAPHDLWFVCLPKKFDGQLDLLTLKDVSVVYMRKISDKTTAILIV